MLDSLRGLALDVKYLDRARQFYEGPLGLTPRVERGCDERPRTVTYQAGETALTLRAPGPVPRGGLHTHYAFTTADGTEAAWRERFAAADLSVEDATFGSYRSLYVDDPDDHCVEVGVAAGEAENDRWGVDQAPPLTGVFEVVLEVEDLTRSVGFYRTLGFEVSDRGDDRPRVRLSGPVDLELWEPQLGLADARGGVHGHLTFGATDPDAVLDAAGEDAEAPQPTTTDGVDIRDPDGHWLTVQASGGE